VLDADVDERSRSRSPMHGGPEVKIDVPDDHLPLIPTPKGGSSCANCRFVDAEAHECNSPEYVEWNGGPELPSRDLDSMCSDWWEPEDSEKALGKLIEAIKSRSDD
jgi:hypothetical protein